MKIRIDGFIYEIASMQVLDAGATIHVQFVEPKQGLLYKSFTAAGLAVALVWEA